MGDRRIRVSAVGLIVAASACASQGTASPGDGAVRDRAITDVRVSDASSDVAPGDGAVGDASTAPHDVTFTNPDVPPHQIVACPTATSAIGTWENITPDYLVMYPSYTGALVPLVNPTNPAIVYLTTDTDGIFRSSDCGATWAKVNTGRNGGSLDGGRPWWAVLDPVSPDTIYVVIGYGANNLWKSTNSGVDWDPMFPPGSEVATIVPGTFVEHVSMDPTNHLHLVVNFHDNSTGGHSAVCLAESHDAGATWQIISGPGTGWAEASGIEMLDGTHWIYTAPFGPFSWTDDAGATWHPVDGSSGANDQLYRGADGTLYIGTLTGVARSHDGRSWEVLANSPSRAEGVVGDGTHLYASQQNGNGLIASSTEADPTTWTEMPNHPSSGYVLAYDRDHHILYAIADRGLWRVVTY